jgi:hypothetical protein
MSNGPGTSPQLPALASQVWGCQLAPHAAPAFLQGQTKGRGLACALAKLPQLETRRCGGGFLTWGYVAGAARRLHRSRILTGSFQPSASSASFATLPRRRWHRDWYSNEISS